MNSARRDVNWPLIFAVCAAHLGWASLYPNLQKFQREGLILPYGLSQPMNNAKHVNEGLRKFPPGA